jgi:hypothetical protein
VRVDGTISVRDHTFGPLDPDLVGMSVDVDMRGPALEVFYNRDLRHRFDFESGETLPLDEEPVAMVAAQVSEV